MLPPYQGEAVKWAYEHCVPHYAYRLSSGRTTCMECGHSWQTTEKNVRCPNCGRKLSVKNTQERSFCHYRDFCILTTFRGLQLQRIFKLTVTLRKGRPAEYRAEEIVRYWLNELGKVEITAKSRAMSYYIDSLNMFSDIELRKDCQVYRWMSDCTVYPHKRLLPVLRRNGLTGKFPDFVPPLKLMESVLIDPRIETILKAGRKTDLSYFLNGTRELACYWPSYKIVLRNHYAISDTGLWCDLVRLLKECGKDTHNAHYVCPDNLKDTHDHFLRMKREIDKKRESEEQRKRALVAEVEFEKMKGKFFGLQFTDGLVVVSVLDSVEAYYMEGEAMHHCVGSMEYYKKPDSLVLSARIDGVRVETVEVSLVTFKVLQSRGACNKNTKYHEEIIDLVNKNMNLIRKAV